jgi:polyhydroxyalkanoate synthesis regulator phasin
MDDIKKIIEDSFYATVGVTAKIVEHISDNIDEYREKGKEVAEKGKDFNKELKHKAEDLRDELRSGKKDVKSILEDMTDEEKEELKEALLNDGKKEK